jgi:hypothetical protein
MRTPVSVHKKIISSLAVSALVVLFGMTGAAEAQYRGGRVVVAPRVVVGGGYYYRPYFYDPFWFDPWYGFAYGQYPWGPYGYPPYGGYRVDPGASLRLEVKPKEAEVYATYLKKLNDQEKEIDTLTEKQKKLMGDEFAAHKKYDDYLAAISD